MAGELPQVGFGPFEHGVWEMWSRMDVLVIEICMMELEKERVGTDGLGVWKKERSK